MSDLPRLLLCSFDVIPGPSGSSRRVTEYLKALPDRFSVVVLSAKTPDHSHIEKYQGARLLRVPVGSGDLASRIQAFERAVRRQLESEDYALAHFTDPFGGYALCELKADYGYRLIYEAQTFPSQELRYTHPQTEGDRRFLSKIRRQELFCLMNADLIITGSRTTRSYIQSLGASEELIRVLRAPVDLQPYAPDVLGVPDGQPLRLMYLGSQVGWQGLSTLLRAVALAVKQADVRLTLVGARHADWQPHLDDLVKELGLQERVEFQPPVHHDDVAKVLALADVGVLPLDDVERNRLQGGPLAKVSEYFAAGRPVIAADLPVTRELIPSGTALFFPPGDTQALANHIVDLARDVPRRVELGRRARAHAEEALDAGVIRGKLLDLYDSLLEKRTVPVAARGEDDLPSPTTVTGTPTNRLAALLPPEGTPVKKKPEAGDSNAAPAESAEPSREELPLVMGQVLDEGLDTRLIKTELEVQPSEPPVVMGLPLRESEPSPSTVEVSESLSEPLAAAPTPVVRAPSVAEEPPPPTPVVRSPALAEEPPAPTPVVRGSTVAEEPPAPTPIVKVPAALLMRDEAVTPSSTSRGASPSPRKDEPPAAPSRPSLAGRSTSARVETPSGRIPSLSTPSRGTSALESERPRSAPSQELAIPPVLRGASPEPERPRVPTQETVIPPVLRGASAEPERPRVPPQDSALPPMIRGGTASTEAERPPSLPPRASAPPPVPRQRPPQLPPAEPPRLTPMGSPGSRPVMPPSLKASVPNSTGPDDEPVEISPDEAQPIDDGAEASATPAHPRPRLDEPDEISSDEVEEAEISATHAARLLDDEADLHEVEAEPVPAPEDEGPAPEPMPSTLNPWFAQLAHGYCPPDGIRFDRHTPPTTFPGRDEDTNPSRTPPAPRAQGVVRGKSS